MPKKFELIKQTKPLQLSLFELLTETDILTEDGDNQLKRGSNYSQTIELYDFMPRFVFGHQADLRKDYNGLLPALVRDFECRGVPFKLTLTPATIVQSNGDSISYYPGTDEDILEIVLRKMYLEDNPKLYDGQPGMTFTVNRIRKELKKQGRTRSHTQVIESLLILKGSQISCQNLETKTTMIFNPIDVLSFRKRDDTDVDTPCYLIFSNIVAEALDNLYFRRFNYRKVVSYKSVIARLLHRRISHHFTQSNPKLTYSVNFSTLLRDFGLEYPTLAKAFIKLKEALQEMKDANVIQEFTCDPIRNAKDARKIEDYFVKITPTQAFSFEVKNSNDIRINISRMSEDSEDLNQKSSKKSKKSTSFFPEFVKAKTTQDK
ncbi:MAG: hypothetical protein ACR2MD_06795 [Aridibacter sp.]